MLEEYLMHQILYSMEKNRKIEKYHFEEIVLILLIFVSDLSNCTDSDLESFNECVEGRIETLFTKDFLSSLHPDYGINESVIFELEKIRESILSFYEARWFTKLIKSNKEIEEIRKSASKILGVLNVSENDPKRFSEEHLNLDW
jgi:hypothetical protein